MSSKLLINNTLNVKGAILNVQDMINIENAKDNITEDDALKIADRAIEIMDDSDYTEEDAINIAREELGYAKAFFG